MNDGLLMSMVRDPVPVCRYRPGRDRLADNTAFDQLRDLVRFSLDFYANRYCRLRVQAAEEARVQAEPPSLIYGRAIAILDDNREEISQDYVS